MNVYFYTLGCRLNQCETESVAYSFEKHGFNILQKKENADLIIVNSCTVTSKAEQKARRMIRIFAKICPVLVTGCYAQMNEDKLASLSPNVVIYSLDLKSRLMDLPEYIKKGGEDHFSIEVLKDFKKGLEPSSRFLYEGKDFSYHSRAYLKIQDGCDNSCGYCRVTVARGKSVSLESSEVIKRAIEIEKEGYKEIMLTGVNLTQYDYQGDGLGGLLEKLLSVLGPDIRLRLSSMEPDHVDDRLLEQLKDYRMQPHFHIPVQSASDKVLERVNRKYNKSHLEYIIRRLKVIKDDPFIACDVITGLPGEGEAEAEETYNFLKTEGFSQLHVFPFSPRPDTPLYKAKDKDCEYIRDKRAKRLRDLSEELLDRYTDRQDGKELEVILEKNNSGLTENYLHVEVTGLPENAKRGDLFRAIYHKKGKTFIIPPLVSHIRFFSEVTSTNAILLEATENGAPDGTVFIADKQTMGRGRMDRSFFSPEGGIFISILLPLSSAERITAMAGVAVCSVIEEHCNKESEIKWINDVLINGKKVCGILAQITKDQRVVLGVGINFSIKQEDFPFDIRDKASSIFSGEDIPSLTKKEFALLIVQKIINLAQQRTERWLPYYKSHSAVTGHTVTVAPFAEKVYTANAVSIDRNCHLHVITEDGEERILSTGEITLRIKEIKC